MSKTCFKCNELKPLSDFYSHSRMRDGHLNKCKDCTKNDSKTYRGLNAEEQNRKDRERKRGRSSEKRKEYRREYRKLHPEVWDGYKTRNMEKISAATAVHNALRSGNIKKPGACEICGKSDTVLHGHHHDYCDPLSVWWLCVLCHSRLHILMRDVRRKVNQT